MRTSEQCRYHLRILDIEEVNELNPPLSQHCLLEIALNRSHVGLIIPIAETTQAFGVLSMSKADDAKVMLSSA